MEQRARGTGPAVGWIRCRPGQIVASQQRTERGARRIVEGRVSNPKVEILRQERMLKRSSGFEVVFALDVGHVRAKSGVGQFSLLIERRRGASGDESCAVRKHVSARVVIKPVLADETAEGEQRRGADQAGPHRGNVESLDLRALVLRRQWSPCERVVHSNVQVINRIWSLEPRARVLKVRVDRIRAGYVVID